MGAEAGAGAGVVGGLFLGKWNSKEKWGKPLVMVRSWKKMHVARSNQLRGGMPQVRMKSGWSSAQQHLGAYGQCQTPAPPQSRYCSRWVLRCSGHLLTEV